MNVHASALAEAHLPDEQTSTFAREAIGDLSQRPKRLSPKYFYDATGSELFEASRGCRNITRPAPNFRSCGIAAARSRPSSRKAPR